MKTILFCLMAMGMIACRHATSDSVVPGPADTVASEYADWYVLKSPIDRPIVGVWGDIDKTVLITTNFYVFRSTDRGRNWQQVFHPTQGVYGMAQIQDTLFALLGLLNEQYLVSDINYSTDDGQTWQYNYRRNPPFREEAIFDGKVKGLSINPVMAATGTAYKINRYFFNDPTPTVGDFETPGVITSTNRTITLPQLHQLTSLYLDSKERLYITGSDAVCDGRQKFHFCNSKQGRGVVYVSKKSLP